MVFDCRSGGTDHEFAAIDRHGGAEGATKDRAADGRAGKRGGVVAPSAIRLALEDVNVVGRRPDDQPAVGGVEIHVDAEARSLTSHPPREGGRRPPVEALVEVGVDLPRNLVRDKQGS